MPGPGGANNEAGLLWFVTNDGLNEQCSYRSTIGGLGVLANRVQFRVAVNDNARFRVGLYRISNGVCVPFLAFLTTTTSDDSQFRTTFASFATSRICRVQLLLTDDPNTFNAAIDTTSALIDYVRLLNGTTRTWQESFTN
ncbi:MAG: hypothetical protein IPK16_13500 [Anaerolineales bacterium]|nr:hypothetical protein [Anaerolineales bacterium]